MNNKKKIIVFGCSFTPFLIIIAGAVIYSSSLKNNVRQKNLQLEEKKKEEKENNLDIQTPKKEEERLQDVNGEKKEVKSGINYQEQIENKEEKKEKEAVINNQNKEEEYIPVLDNYKIQIGLWFASSLRFEMNESQDAFKNNYPYFFAGLKKGILLKYYNELLVNFINKTILFFVNEFFISFLYLIFCLVNKKPWTKAFSVDHRFWWKSWKNFFLSLIINFAFYFISFILGYSLEYYLNSFNYSNYQKTEFKNTNKLKFEPGTEALPNTQ